MLKPYTYLLIEFFTVIPCFIFSFNRRIQFSKHFDSFIKAAAVAAIPFIAWDIWFVKTGIWWFDSSYTTGHLFFGLPLEEILFFICIPFSCVFTYFCLTTFFDLSPASGFNNIIVFIAVVVCSVIALLYSGKMYTLLTALLTLSVLIYFHFIKKIEWIGQASLVYLLLMPGFFAVNAILTGTGLESPIVNYNPAEFLGIRLLSIPVEDAVYGYAQFLVVLYLFKHFQSAGR